MWRYRKSFFLILNYTTAAVQWQNQYLANLIFSYHHVIYVNMPVSIILSIGKIGVDGQMSRGKVMTIIHWEFNWTVKMPINREENDFYFAKIILYCYAWCYAGI